jgi:hypothetical protein
MIPPVIKLLEARASGGLFPDTMRNVIQYLAVPALVVGAPAAWATTYLSIEQAQTAIFPEAKLQKLELELTPAQRKAIEQASNVRVRQTKLRVWKVEGGGWFFVDEVVGKHEFITYAVGVNEDGCVKQIEVMDYRETYGSQVRDEKWRAQFAGKTSKSRFKLDDDIKNVSGATLSCRNLANGVKRLLATHELVLKQ